MANKNHCCPYCGSDNVTICASPVLHVSLDDEGHCDDIVDSYESIMEQVNDLGPEDFVCTCNDCEKDFNIVFEEADHQEYRFVKCKEGRACDFERKYTLLFHEQEREWKEAHKNKKKAS